MKSLGLAALLSLLPAGASGQEEPVVVRRCLELLCLGKSLQKARSLYPPSQEWASSQVPQKRVTRIRVERGQARNFPDQVQTILMGIRKGRLVEVQLIYDAAYTRKKSAEALARDFSLLYGGPKRSGDKFWWSDGRTVLRVFDAARPAEGKGVVELRTAVQIMEQDLFQREDR